MAANRIKGITVEIGGDTTKDRIRARSFGEAVGAKGNIGAIDEEILQRNLCTALALSLAHRCRHRSLSCR